MDPLITSDEVAAFLRVDVVTIRRLVNRGELTAYRVGSEYRFMKSDLDDYLQKQRVSADRGEKMSTNPNNPVDQFTQWLRQTVQGKQATLKDIDRFDRFTKRASKVLTLAQEEAQRLQHNYIGTEHLLLGLVREGEGVAAQALSNLGIELTKVRTSVETIIGKGDQIVLGEVGLTPRAKKVIELAVEEARRLHHHYIGTEHLLLGLIREGNGIAAGVLETLGVKLERARTETIQILGRLQQDATTPIQPVPEQAASLVAAGELGIICVRCGARSPGYFRYCFNCGSSLAQEE